MLLKVKYTLQSWPSVSKVISPPRSLMSERPVDHVADMALSLVVCTCSRATRNAWLLSLIQQSGEDCTGGHLLCFLLWSLCLTKPALRPKKKMQYRKPFKRSFCVRGGLHVFGSFQGEMRGVLRIFCQPTPSIGVSIERTESTLSASLKAWEGHFSCPAHGTRLWLRLQLYQSGQLRTKKSYPTWSWKATAWEFFLHQVQRINNVFLRGRLPVNSKNEENIFSLTRALWPD